jgi:hypothetical protein
MEEKKIKPNGYWTLEICKEDAKKYTSRGEWQKKSGSAYNKAFNNGWVDECCNSMTEGRVIYGYWTLDRCKEDALKYENKKEWRDAKRSGYRHASKMKWLDQCCGHMKEVKKPNGYWTLEKCKEDALKYKNIKEWQVLGKPSYSAAYNKKWIKKCSKYMIRPDPHNKINTLESCAADALKYKSKTEWRKKSNNMYRSAYRAGWINQCCGHMKRPNAYNKKWTKDLCKKDALIYLTITDWKNGKNSSYSKANDRGWMTYCTNHMERPYRGLNYWDEERCRKEALKYNSRSEFYEKASTCAWNAKKLGIIEECLAHIKKGGATSRQEKDLFLVIKTHYPDTISKFFNSDSELFFQERYELDIYIPSLNLGIEFNGKYWHGKGFKRKWTNDPKEYHKVKRRFFESIGIRYLEINECKWLENKEKCVQECLNFLSKYGNTIK